MAERFSTPDEYASELRASDLYALERARVITDAHTFIVPLIWLAVAVFFFLGARALAGPAAQRLRQRLGRWLIGDRRPPA